MSKVTDSYKKVTIGDNIVLDGIGTVPGEAGVMSVRGERLDAITYGDVRYQYLKQSDFKITEGFPEKPVTELFPLRYVERFKLIAPHLQNGANNPEWASAKFELSFEGGSARIVVYEGVDKDGLIGIIRTIEVIEPAKIYEKEIQKETNG